jgi:hypothetical protein
MAYSFIREVFVQKFHGFKFFLLEWSLVEDLEYLQSEFAVHS